MEESRTIPIRQIMEALGFIWNYREYVHPVRKTVVSEAYALDYMRDLIWDGEGAKITRPSYSRTAIPCTEYDTARFSKIFIEFKD